MGKFLNKLVLKVRSTGRWLQDWWRRQSVGHRALIFIILFLIAIRLLILAADSFARSRVVAIDETLTQVHEIERQLQLAPTPQNIEVDRTDNSLVAHNMQLQTIRNNLDASTLDAPPAWTLSPNWLVGFPKKPKASVDVGEILASTEQSLTSAKQNVTYHYEIMNTLQPFFAYDPVQDLSVYSTDKAEAAARIKNAQEGLAKIRNSLERQQRSATDPELSVIITSLDAHIAQLARIDSKQEIKAFADSYNESQRKARSNRSAFWQSSKAHVLQQLSKSTEGLLSLHEMWNYAVNIIP